MAFPYKDFLGIEPLKREEIELILKTSRALKEISTRDIKKVPALRGKTVVNLFYEPSTRTRVSFELAAKRLSADNLNISASSSSLVKGESILDMAKTLEALNTDFIVIRHSSAGVPHMLAKHLKASIINAGDGFHEHPSQAMLDLLTIEEAKGRLEGVNVLIVGDIYHSRVARSNIYALTKMGANVTVVGPKTLLPPVFSSMGINVSYNLGECIPDADVIMMLRIQEERQKDSLLPSTREYRELYGLTLPKLKRAKRDVLIMHPGPVRRGVEISPEVADGLYSVILDQVANGLAVRMALFFLLVGGGSDV